MDENIAPEVVENTTPAEDPILSALSDTEDSSDEPVVETPNEEVSEAETEPEVEQPIEKTDEIDTPVDPKEEARRRYEERQAYREEQRAKIAKETESYTAEAQDEYDQRLRAMEVQRYTELIENTQDKLVTEFERAKANPDLQMFNPESDKFNQKIYEKAIRDYNSGYINYDTNGNMVGLKSSLYEHLTETADLFQGAVKTGQIQQVRDSRQMKSRADVKPAATPKVIDKDPILEMLQSD
jgi:hypothetical protein